MQAKNRQKEYRDVKSLLDVQKMESLREALKLSQEEAAQAARLGGRQKWSDLIGGRRSNITLSTLIAIAKALNCEPRDLLLRVGKGK